MYIVKVVSDLRLDVHDYYESMFTARSDVINALSEQGFDETLAELEDQYCIGFETVYVHMEK